MKKLLIPTDTFLPKLDGATSFLKETIPRLKEKFDITVMCPDFGEIKKDLGIRIVRFKPLSFKVGDITPSMPDQAIIKREVRAADIVWVQGALAPITSSSIMAAKRIRRPLHVMTHILEWDVFPKGYGSRILSTPINMSTLVVARMMYNMCATVMVPSQEVAELMTLLGIHSRKNIVRLGVDSERFCPPKDKKEAKRAVGLDPDSYLIGFIGRLALEKDLKTLYRAFSRVYAKHRDSRLIIVGDGREDVKQMFRRKESIILLGPKEDVVPYFQALDVHVLTSLVETANLSTLEAMSCGCAVVATPVGYVKEYIKDKMNGLIIPKQDSFTLSKKLDLLRSRQLREELGGNARKTILEKFSIELTVKNILEVLSEQPAGS